MSVRASLVKLIIFTIVTVFVTAILGMTIGNIRLRDYATYKAEFSDVTGLLKGDDVRVAGVQVGRVRSTRVKGAIAEVTFQLERDIPITTSVRARIRYRNLLGQRYIALSEGTGTGERLRSGALIPLGQTSPALDLTALFNGFKPIFETVQPADVNKLAEEIVRTLQGEGGTVDSLLAHTASLTNTLADRDAAIGRVVGNLALVTETIATRDDQLGLFIKELQRLSTGLAGDRDAIGESLANIDALAEVTADLLHDARPALDPLIRDLATVVHVAAGKTPQLQEILTRLPQALAALDRAQSNGSWMNLYVLDLTININGNEIPVPANAIAAALDAAGRGRARAGTAARPQVREGAS